MIEDRLSEMLQKSIEESNECHYTKFVIDNGVKLEAETVIDTFEAHHKLKQLQDKQFIIKNLDEGPLASEASLALKDLLVLADSPNLVSGQLYNIVEMDFGDHSRHIVQIEYMDEIFTYTIVKQVQSKQEIRREAV